jgi:pSer/pThr/pTyr-binding forkhead associated (FHA) protein
MSLTIVVRSGEATSSPAICFDSPRIVIGRGEGCEVRLPDASVSHRHASIRQRGTEYIIVDEGSTNGTFVGSVRLSPQAPRVLRTGDLIRVGRVWLQVRIEQTAPTQNQQLVTAEIALALVERALAAQGEAAMLTVKVAEGPDAGQNLPIIEFERPYVLGRGANVDLKLEDVDASRRHVEILRRGSQLYVRELGSKNGSRLGNRPLESGKAVPWPKSEFVYLGQNRLTYEDPVLEALSELERSADETMREDDSIEPPRVEPDADAEALSARPVAADRASPIARAQKRPKSAQRSGWSTTDWLVALLAVIVLGLSILGLFWLLGPPGES